MHEFKETFKIIDEWVQVTNKAGVSVMLSFDFVSSMAGAVHAEDARRTPDKSDEEPS